MKLQLLNDKIDQCTNFAKLNSLSTAGENLNYQAFLMANLGTYVYVATKYCILFLAKLSLTKAWTSL